MGARTYSFDAKMLLADGASAMVASGLSQVGGASAILDLGGTLKRTDLGIVGNMARIDMAIVIDVSALVVSAANDLYSIVAIGSNNANLSGGQVLGRLDLGNTSALPNGAATSVAGRYEMLLSTEQADVNFEYLGLYVLVAGTGASITFKAFGAVLPCI